MDFALTAEQEAMRDSVRRTVARDIQPILDQHDRTRPLPKPVFIKLFGILANIGMTAPRLPEERGGSNLKMLDYGIMFEQLPPSLSMSLVSQDVCTARIYAECSPEQQDRFLPDLIAGRKLGCTGSTEPGAGSDPRGIKTRVTQKGNKLVINGRKMWVTNISMCDTIIVMCLDGREGAPEWRIVKVVVERDKSPFEGREIDTIGLNQGLLGEAVFDDCEVPLENLIESKAGGTTVLKNTWNVNRPLLGLQCVHLAQKAFDAALEYSQMRTQFGKPIAAHQLIQANLSDADTAIVASRLLSYRALWMIDQGLPAEGAAALAKRFAQMSCQNAIWQAMNILGAMGLSREARIEEAYRDIRMIAIPDGTNEILTLIHGRELTGMEAIRGTVRTTAPKVQAAE